MPDVTIDGIILYCDDFRKRTILFAPRLRKHIPARQTLLFPTFFERSPVQIWLSPLLRSASNPYFTRV